MILSSSMRWENHLGVGLEREAPGGKERDDGLKERGKGEGQWEGVGRGTGG